MLQSFELLLKGGFFQEALPEAAFWGHIALGVGIAGFLASQLLVLMHLRDQASLTRGEHKPREYRPPKWGPLNQSLREFFTDPVRSAPLSPDAAAEYVLGRLEATRDAALSAIRYFSYTPLLFGLMGTIFALRALLVLQGNTLQQIQPSLAGVFAGTLAGIVGSLFASAGAVMLDWVSLSAVNRAQDFIHRHILPTLPERRIAIRIEDAVLAVIGEKAQAVAQSFSNSMQPVASHMEDIAERCGKAADVAMKSLTEAARAVHEAGNIEVASRDFKIGAHMVDSAAEQLSDATKHTAEVVLRIGEIRQSLDEVLSRIRETSQNLAETSSRVTVELSSRISELSSQGEHLSATASALYPAMSELSSELIRRAASDSGHLEVIRAHIEGTNRSVTDVTNILNESASHLKAIPTRIDEIAGMIADGTRQGVATAMEQVVNEVARKLDGLAATLDRSAGAFSTAFNESTARDRTRGETSLDFVRSICQAADEMRKVSEESRKLTAALQQAQLARGNGASKKADGFFRRLWDR
jgi:hypothetical protein